MTSPVLDLNFSGSRGLDPRLSFFRASTATYWDEAGLLRTAAVNQPRIDHDPVTKRCRGLLIEEVRTNVLLRSSGYDYATAWTRERASVAADAVTAPDGTTTADTLTEHFTDGTHRIYQVFTSTAAAWTGSIFVKAAGRTKVWLRLQDGTDEYGAAFDLSAGTTSADAATVTPAIQAVGSGWYRVAVTRTLRASASASLVFYILDDAGTSSYSGNTSLGVHVWGAQAEAGGFATSYIPTTTAAATRGADTATLDLGLVPDWDSAQGTVVADTQAMAAVNGSMLWSLGGAGSAYVMHAGTTGLQARAATASTTQATIATPATQTIPNKTAFTWATNDFALVTNGEVSGSDSTGSAPSVTSLQIGMAPWAYESFLNGWVRRLTLYNRRLVNPDLQTLTARSPAIRLRLDALQYLPQEVSFSRASTATYWDSAGVLRTAPAGTPRFDFDPVGLVCRGLLIEEARTNTLWPSGDLSHANWGKSALTVSADTTAAPDGTTTANKLQEDTSTGIHYMSGVASITAGQSVVFSAFIKAGERSRGQLQIAAAVDGVNALFDLSAKTVTLQTFGASSSATTGLIECPNGWFRVWVKAVINGSSTSVNCRVYTATTSTSYTGSAGSGFYVWGLQSEVGGIVTSLIPTTTAAATRSADVATINLDDLPSMTQAAGTLVVEGSMPVPTSYPALTSLDDTTGTNFVRIIGSPSGTLYGEVYAGGVNQATINLGTVGANTVFRAALAWATNDVAASRDGGTVTPDTTATIPRVTQVQIGRGLGGAMNGHLREIAVWPVRSSNAVTQLLA